MQENFKYEVTPEPMTLFRNGMMRKSGKLVIRNHLFNKYPSCDCPSSRSLVIDGECFVTQSKVVLWFLICRHHRFLYPIHLKLIFYVWKCHHYFRWLQPRIVDQIFWTKNKNFTGCCSRCGFNKGYNSHHYLQSISSEHKKTRKKDQLIKFLLVQLRELSFLTYQSERDFDTFIVEGALQEATLSTIYVVAEDTGTLILLIHHWDNSKDNVFFTTEKRQKWAIVNKWCNIECFKEGNVIDWMGGILFTHAWGGWTQHCLLIAKINYFTYFLRLCYMSPLKNWTPILK